MKENIQFSEDNFIQKIKDAELVFQLGEMALKSTAFEGHADNSQIRLMFEDLENARQAVMEDLEMLQTTYKNVEQKGKERDTAIASAKQEFDDFEKQENKELADTKAEHETKVAKSEKESSRNLSSQEKESEKAIKDQNKQDTNQLNQAEKK